jgi:membrane-associated protein
MNYRSFIFFNLAGGLLWTVSMIGGGYIFGTALPADQVDKYLLPVIALIIVISVLPAVSHLYQGNREAIHRAIRERSLAPLRSSGE